jgi:hypothetical protein
MLGHSHCYKAQVGRNLLDLSFSNFNVINIKNAELPMVTPDYHHPPLVTDMSYQLDGYYRMKDLLILIMLLETTLCYMNL